MAYRNYHKRKIADRELHPETQMMSYGYDPFLSEGSVKPPVFLTSTFAFRTAEDGAEFFDVVAGRKPSPEGEGAGLVYSRFNHEPGDRRGSPRPARRFRSRRRDVERHVGHRRDPADLPAAGRLCRPVRAAVRRHRNTDLEVPARVGHSLGSDRRRAVHPRDSRRARSGRAKGHVRMCYIETPANPTNALFDLEGLRGEIDAFEARHGYRPLSVCDNTLLGPLYRSRRGRAST